MSFPKYGLNYTGLALFTAELMLAAQYLQNLGINSIRNGKLIYDPYVIFAQAALESGNFQSRLYRDHGNAFGMNAPNSRKYYSELVKMGGGEPQKAGYKTAKIAWRNSQGQTPKPAFVDYLQRQHQFKVSPTNFVYDTWRTGYATDPNYAKAWKNRFDTIFGDNANWANFWRLNLRQIDQARTTGAAPTPGRPTNTGQIFLFASVTFVAIAIINRKK